MEKRGLNREVITRAALAVLDEAGLAELSTRRLAARLGVQSPTLYWHVKNKAELLDLVAEAICADTISPDPGAPWRDQLSAALDLLHTRLSAHRDTAALLRERPPGPHRRAQTNALTEVLHGAGFAPDDAETGTRLLLGHVLDSVPAADPHFTRGVTIILDGLEQRLRR